MCATFSVLALTLAGCSNGSRIEPSEAKQSVVEIVDGSTALIGGEWKLIDGPGVSSCPKPRGGRGASYVYAKTSDVPGGERAKSRAVEAYWADLGLDAERYEGGRPGGDHGIIARGENGSFVDLTISSDHLSLISQSECMDRDPDPLRTPLPEL